MITAKLCCGKCNSGIKVDHTASAHEGSCYEGFRLAALLQNPFEDFEHADSRDDQIGRVLDCSGEEIGIRRIGEILQPSGRIDDIHTRSLSRMISVSIPRKRPRNASGMATGMSSSLPS